MGFFNEIFLGCFILEKVHFEGFHKVDLYWGVVKSPWRYYCVEFHLLGRRFNFRFFKPPGHTGIHCLSSAVEQFNSVTQVYVCICSASDLLDIW